MSASPLVVNYLLSHHILWNYKVVGEGKDWIAYYGSLISTIIAFFILYKTLNQNTKLSIITQKHQDLYRLKEDLSKRISNIDITQVIQSILFIEDFNYQQELYRLNALSQFYTKESNATFLLYGFTDNTHSKNFCSAYCTCLDKLVKEDIHDLTILVKKLQNHEISKDDYLNGMIKISNRITNERQQYFRETVCKLAYKYITSEEEQYETLKNEL